jgi:hypothetical protein
VDHSIEKFWKTTFDGVASQEGGTPLPGWDFRCLGDESFVPARLLLREDYADLTQPVWLIGAPGAVGKSTLAREICAATGAVYLDLADAATVAGNYIVGGLVHTNLLTSWTAGKTAILVDALDEARLRVTQSGFEAFLADVCAVAKLGKFPLIVLGRVGIIEEAWSILNDHDGLEPPIFDIELFSPEEAEAFVMARLKKLSRQRNAADQLDYPDLGRSLTTHGTVYSEAIHQVVSGLQQLSAQDGNRFIGYAPVLDAVAKVIASESNPARIGEEMQRVLEGKVLKSLTDQILRREATKLVTQVSSSTPNLPSGLYEPAEQLQRLASRLFKLKPPAIPSQLTQQQVASYEQAVGALLPQHPFLDGTGNAPSSAVFAACIVAAALRGSEEEISKAAERYASLAQHTPNPFLYDFYESEASAGDSMPAEHIGLVFESVLAKSKPGDSVRLSVEGEEEHPQLSVEIMIARSNEDSTRLEFAAPSSGTIRLGRRVSGVSIDAEETDVELGIGDQLELVAPVFISARALALSCNQIAVKSEPHSPDDDTVILEAKSLIADPAVSAPSVRGGAKLQVSWPESSTYPWTPFSAPQTMDEDPTTTDALRALRRITMAFRSHSKGELARFKDKIEHQRMLKGSVGQALLRKLTQDKVIQLRGPMYYLDPNVLGEKVGASFLNVKLT